MDYKGALYGLLAAQTKKTDEELAALLENVDGEGLQDNALETLLDIDKERVATLVVSAEDKQKLFDDGFRKAQSQTLGSFENKLKEQFSITSEATGTDLVSAIVKANSTTVTTGEPKEITPDNIRKSATFIDEQEKWKLELETTNTDWEAKMTEHKTAHESAQVFAKVKEQASQIISGLNPVFSNDPAKATKQRGVILNELDKFKFELQDNRTVVLKPDGQVLVDDHQNRVEFKDLVKTITTSIYDLKVASPRDTAGGDRGNNGVPPVHVQTPDKFDFKVPQSAEEYMSTMKGAASTEERGAITAAWQEVKKQSVT